jgi:hypothetical protein
MLIPMKKYFPLIKPALVLTPGIFMLGFWILLFSPSSLLNGNGVYWFTLMALPMSFAVAYSVAMFAEEMLNHGK